MSASVTRQGGLREHASLYAAVVRAWGKTLIRRAKHGRRHAEWTLPYEMAMTALRVAAQEFPELALELAAKQTAPLPPSLASKVRIEQRRMEGMDVEIHTPSHHAPGAPTLLFLHGGGFVTCSPRSHRDVIARIAHVSGARCIAPHYRLAPKHPFPAALHDALACYRALLTAGTPPDSLFVAGDSAGGGLSVSLLVSLRDAGEPLPRGAVLLSPWVDLDVSSRPAARQSDHDYVTLSRLLQATHYAGSTPLTHPLVSPVHADLRGLPPLLVQTGEWELLHEQNLRFVERARAAGLSVRHTVAPGMLHAFTCFAGIAPQGARAVAEIGAFLGSLSHRGVPGTVDQTAVPVAELA